MALAWLESWRRLDLPKELKTMLPDEQLSYMRTFIAGYLDILSHEKKYISSLGKPMLEYLYPTIADHIDSVKGDEGNAAIWGKPVGFYCHLSENHVLKLDLDGNVIEDINKEVPHGGATLSI